MSENKHILIDGETHRRARIAAAREGKPLKQIVTELIERWLKRSERKSDA